MAVITFIVFFFVAIGIAIYHSESRKGKGLPPGISRLPGPKGIPFIGRVHDVPSKATWLKFHQWSQEYGPIFQMEIFGTVHVWIGSDQIANDLLASRGSIYSDRPMIPNLPDNRTSGAYLPLLGRNETWKRQRKFAHHAMNRSAATAQHSYPAIELKRLLYNLSKDPSNYQNYTEEFTGRTISRLAWGSTEHFEDLKEDTQGLLAAISPSGAVPNVVSWLTKLPVWLSPWKQTEQRRREKENDFFSRARRSVEVAMAKGTAQPSYMQMFLEGKDKKENGWHDQEGGHQVGMLAIAGALTLASPLMSYILAMCHYPEWQAKLQNEIEAVLGGRCPKWEDREQLPLLRAVVKEVLRWRPPVPTGIPHSLEKDDIYNGYLIPEGATIHALEWSITRDQAIYPDPETFRPERWLVPTWPSFKAGTGLKGYHQFGHGRRVCQGVDIVEQELFLGMGGLAWAFHIGKSRDANGNEVAPPLDDYTSLLIAKPEHFEFDMKVRSLGKKAMIEKAWKSVNGGRTDDVEVDMTQMGLREKAGEVKE
ncbi:hypothetical protein BP6252_08000 [Coleophoma cylindrospora]|uniref:Cytochrome P450 n=1 Tax=Coleophoma cylindrospora TaxID=1849047 RepID=A0A3D8RBL0_9HELO|nr:hypothetical protein BP6252_08000 [Coleophoma cylindrospora]